MDVLWRLGAEEGAHDKAAAGDPFDYQAGLGAAMESEALPNVLPKVKNSPRRVAYRTLWTAN